MTRPDLEEAAAKAIDAAMSWLPNVWPGDESSVTDEDYTKAREHGLDVFRHERDAREAG